ncbi:MAG: redoxin domain-containing protein [Thermoanaerobaculia bacterium]
MRSKHGSFPAPPRSGAEVEFEVDDERGWKKVEIDPMPRPKLGADLCELDEFHASRSARRADAGRTYRFTHLALPLVMKDMYYSSSDPGPGDRVPEFDLPVVGGGRFRSADLASTGTTLLIFGSSTCPVTDNAAPGLTQLHRRFGDRVRFVMVNVREAHPGEAFPQPATLEEKTMHADRLRKLHGFDFDVAVDDTDGTLHRALGSKPNSAYILGGDGTILFRAHWANDTAALESALTSIVAGKPPRRTQSGGLVLPMLRMLPNIAPALDRAGRGAWDDMWLVAPPLAAIAYILKLFGVRSKRHGTGADSRHRFF